MVFNHDKMNSDVTKQIRKLGESIQLWHDQMEQLKAANDISQRQIKEIATSECFGRCVTAQRDIYERVLFLAPTKEKIERLIIDDYSFIHNNEELTESLIEILRAAYSLALVSPFSEGHKRETASDFQVQIRELLEENSLLQKEIQDAIDSRINCSEEIEKKIAASLLEAQNHLFDYIVSSFPTAQTIENLLNTIATEEGYSLTLPVNYSSPDTYLPMLDEITDDYKNCACLRSRYYPQKSEKTS